MPSDAAVRCDPMLLSRIVSNFLSNAVRYTDGGGILLGCRRRGKRLRIEVWDTGTGIEADQLEAIFEEFHQLESSVRDRSKGLGLGLAIVNALASLLGHQVTAASRPGRGSVFSVEVPLAKTLKKQEKPTVTDADSASALAGLRMLVLEDNESILRATEALLRRWGCEVAAAPTFQAALDATDGGTSDFDIVVADYRLDEDYNGVDSVLHIRRRLGRPVPAIIVTADTSSEILQHAADQGLRLLHKPVRPAALRAAILQTLSEPMPIG